MVAHINHVQPINSASRQNYFLIKIETNFETMVVLTSYNI